MATKKDLKVGDIITWGSKYEDWKVREIREGVPYGYPYRNHGESTLRPYHGESEIPCSGPNITIIEREGKVLPSDWKAPKQSPSKVQSDGGSTLGYYAIPEYATELRHLISMKGMSFARGNIFKACYRLGEKDGIDTLYDLKKIKFFAEELIEMHERGDRL